MDCPPDSKGEESGEELSSGGSTTQLELKIQLQVQTKDALLKLVFP